MKTYRDIPLSMKSMHSWALWKLNLLKEQKGQETIERWTKVPYSALDFQCASSSDSSTWTDFDTAMKALETHREYKGLAFFLSLSSGIVFTDVDHCIRNGVYDATAQEFINSLSGGSYVELSQSGTGLHFFTLGDIPKNFNNHAAHVEMYSRGRFAAMTGKALFTNGPRPCEELSSLFDKYATGRRETLEVPTKPSHTVDRSFSDDEVLQHAARNQKFKKLFDGDWSSYPSHSEGDFALCCYLAFWTNGDTERIDRLFRESGLYREEKWDRKDGSYRELTIQNAVKAVESSHRGLRENRWEACQF